MTDDALTWGLIGLAAFLIGITILIHEIGVYRRNRFVTRGIQDTQVRASERLQAVSRERQRVDVLPTKSGRGVVAPGRVTNRSKP